MDKDDLGEGAVASEFLEQTADYLIRGRRFRRSPPHAWRVILDAARTRFGRNRVKRVFLNMLKPWRQSWAARIGRDLSRIIALAC
jgi:hypothetical protein